MLGNEEHTDMLGVFRRRALLIAGQARRKKRQKRDLQNTIAALQEVTGMDPAELQAIADRVQREVASENDRFFSVPAQLAWVAIPVFLGVITIWLTAMLFLNWSLDS